MNSVGLRRANFSKESMSALKQAHRLLLRSSLPLTEALDEMLKLKDQNVHHLVEFIQQSKRGFIRAEKVSADSVD